MRKEGYISLDNCKAGYLYRIDSRNLSYGVYDGNTGFIGIREKFRDRYLDTENHYDTGAPHGTAFPLKELEQVPDGIEIRAYLSAPEVTGLTMNKPLFDYLTSREIEYRFDRGEDILKHFDITKAQVEEPPK